MLGPAARATVVLLVTGCSYLPPATNGPTDGAPMQPPDVLPDPEICTTATDAECIGNTLRECRTVGQLPIDTLCAMCVATPSPHCETLVPSANGADAADLAPDGNVLDITIANNATVDTDSGEIQGVRNAGEGVVDGIGFSVVGNIAIWRFHSLVINGDLDFTGAHAAVFAANRTIDVNGELDLKGNCDFQTPGPGGAAGGIGETDGQGLGKGIRGNGGPGAASGGGGGGHGSLGAAGGSANGQSAPAGGSVYGDPTISMLVGGSGGGGGGGSATTSGVGGGGGGAIQLVANDRITFTASGGINAGGCGAQRQLVNSAAGGGGGAGGTILIEASVVSLSTAVLAVNGGAGSGGDLACGDGENGRSSRTTAKGGNGTGPILNPNTSGGFGGNGGIGGTAAAAGLSGSENKNAGGGGGGIGRIRINTRDNANLDGSCANCSPKFDDENTTLTRGAANIQQ
jgi:hypothetical protein